MTIDLTKRLWLYGFALTESGVEQLPPPADGTTYVREGLSRRFHEEFFYQQEPNPGFQYALGGQDARISSMRHVAATAGAFAHTGQDALITYNPAGLPVMTGLTAWFDVQDLALGTVPATFTDKSGNGYNLTLDGANGSTDPSVVSVAELGNKKAIRFNFGGTCSNPGGCPNRPYRSDNTIFRGPTLTAFFVWRLHSVNNLGSSGAGMVCGCTTTSQPSGWHQITYPSGTPSWQDYYTPSGPFNWGTGADTGAHVFAIVANGTTRPHYRDGTLVGSPNGALSGTQPFFIGMSMRLAASGLSDSTTLNDPAKAPGDFAEFVQYNRVLNGTELTDMTNYFKAKYSIP